MNLKALLFDTRSIQRYVFAGTKLRTNVGASYLVERLFDDMLVGGGTTQAADGQPGVLQEMFGEGLDRTSWIENPDAPISAPCTVGYIGGGKALIFLSGEESSAESLAKEIVYRFTRRLLMAAPGLSTGAAIEDYDASDFIGTQQRLFNRLKQNQQLFSAQTEVPLPGLTRICRFSGESANYLDLAHEIAVPAQNGKATDIMFSQGMAARAKAFERAKDRWQQEFGKVLGDKVFPVELDKQLGQTPGENDIAVVHVDGNRMGLRFQGCATLGDYRRMAVGVRKHTKLAVERLVADVCREYPNYDEHITPFENKAGHICVPIRPLILGGDDVTFVCNAKLALQYTMRLIRYMSEPNEETKALLPDGIDCCGGIAIFRTSYPFARGVVLAEQACDAAKKASRDKPGSSWLDFVLLHGEQAPELDEIRAQEYQGAYIPELHFGPYCVGECESAGEHRAEYLVSAIREMMGAMEADMIARNKVKEMRGILQKNLYEITSYMEKLEHQKAAVPGGKGWQAYRKTLTCPDKNGQPWTPYVDVVEMMEYYVPIGEAGENGDK